MTGWMKHRLPASVLLACTTLAAAAAEPVAPAETTATDRAPGTAPQAHDQDEAFLVFLADWGDEQGNWQDPLEFDDPAWTRAGDRQEKEHE